MPNDLNQIGQPVILFDGVCNLCSSVVQFVIRNDKQDIFRFASLQSDAGKKILRKFHLQDSDFSSFSLYKDGRIYTKSTGALLVAKNLGGGFKFLYAFIIIPKFIRDFIYSFVAKYRYKLFGKKNECWIPDSGKMIKLI